jgi:hypothetical protein
MVVLSNKLCERFGFDSKAYVTAKNWWGSNLYIIMDNTFCTCCGSALGYKISKPPEYRRASFRYIPSKLK